MRIVIGSVVSFLITVSAAQAQAYTVRKADNGEPIRWQQETVEVIVSEDLNEIHPDMLGVLRQTFGAWLSVRDATLPRVNLSGGAVDEIGYRSDRPNHSTIRFAKDGFPAAGGALGVTVLTFDASGQVLDADIVLNGGDKRPFAMLQEDDATTTPNPTSLMPVAYDAQNVLTHEVGHFLGLGEESEDIEATMYVSSAPGETKKRSLADDDVAGAQDLYPVADPASAAAACNLGSSGGSPAWHFSLGVLAVLGAVARRRAKSAGPRSPRLRMGFAFGAAMSALALYATATEAEQQRPQAAASSPSDPLVSTSALLKSSYWEGGLIVTESTVTDDDGRVTTTRSYGGTVGEITQWVGHH